MKTFLILALLASFSSVANAGVGILTPEEESEALSYFSRICGDGSGWSSHPPPPYGPPSHHLLAYDPAHPHPPPKSSPADGEWAGSPVWCKIGPGEHYEMINHKVEVPAATLPDSVVFVQPPPVVFKHDVVVQGKGGVAPKTKIYVLPQKTSHSIKGSFEPGNLLTSKPSVYFLKSGGEGWHRYGSPAPPGIAGYVK